jgi:hypothetical protein
MTIRTRSSKKLRSILDLDLPPLVDAERQLADLSAQRSRLLVGAIALAVSVVPVAAVMPRAGIALAAAAAAALAVAVAVFDRHRTLLSALVQVRDAYRIESVARAGIRFASRTRRERLAEWLRRIVRGAEGGEYHASYTAGAIEARVLARKERLLAVAAALESELHPAGVAIVHRLLTRPSVSPLYNLELGEQILDDALHRVEACIEPAG